MSGGQGTGVGAAGRAVRGGSRGFPLNIDHQLWELIVPPPLATISLALLPVTAAAAAACRELARRVEQFVLRRTREVNARYLPPLTNLVVFCE